MPEDITNMHTRTNDEELVLEEQVHEVAAEALNEYYRTTEMSARTVEDAVLFGATYVLDRVRELVRE